MHLKMRRTNISYVALSPFDCCLRQINLLGGTADLAYGPFMHQTSLAASPAQQQVPRRIQRWRN
jgi:hypothetical protein